MSLINIFKIDENKVEDLKESLGSLGTPFEKNYSIGEISIPAVLYVKNEMIKNDVKWKWVLDEFSAGYIQKEKQAWSAVLIKIADTNYAITFGNAFYYIDKFSDKDFAFEIGRKFEYKQIKSTAQANPNSNKNKTVVSYLNSNYFEYDSGESFIKINGKINLPDGFTLFKESIEIGSSIKLDIENPSLEKCIKALQNINTVSTQNDVTRIPVFVKVKNVNLISDLENGLKQNFQTESIPIIFSDFDIIGTQEVFYSGEPIFHIKYKHHHEQVDNVTEETLKAFCSKRNLNFSEIALDLRIIAKTDEAPDDEYTIKELIDYTDEERKCVLIKGDWYQYNNDYIEELNQSLSEFEVLDTPEFDWTDAKHNEIIAQKYVQEKALDEYFGKTQQEVHCLLKKKYYSERAYNEYLSIHFGYTLLDRRFIEYNGTKVEIADLYKDGCLIATKIGNSSSKLCYAIDQIGFSAKCLKKKQITFENPIKKVASLLVLDRQTKLSVVNGKVNIEELNLLVFKNKLNDWKREMRNLGFEPVLYIGYKH